MKKPKRRGLPRYAIRIALVEIRGEVERYAERYPNIHSYICHACNRVAGDMRLSGTVRAAVRYIQSYVQYKLGSCPTLECWQSEHGKYEGGLSNRSRIAWLTWMLESIEREIYEKGTI